MFSSGVSSVTPPVTSGSVVLRVPLRKEFLETLTRELNFVGCFNDVVKLRLFPPKVPSRSF